MLCDRRNVLVALRRGGFTCNRRHSWRNDDRGSGMTFSDRIVRCLAIIRAIRWHRSNIGIDLVCEDIPTRTAEAVVAALAGHGRDPNVTDASGP
jgi:hypothetical protein